MPRPNSVPREVDPYVAFGGGQRVASEPNPYLAKRWREFVWSSDAMAWNQHGVDSPAEFAGIYFMWGGDATLLYIGQSLGVVYRMEQHKWRGKIPFAYFSGIPMSDDLDLMPIVEAAYICALRPPFNMRIGPVRWDGNDRMAKTIRRLWQSKLVRDDPREIAA